MSQSDVIGCPTDDVDTPALLLDLDVMGRNIQKMTNTILRDAGIHWRPHTKAVKSPALAHKLLDAGAIGVTCAKLGEAEVMAAGGIKDILVCNQVVGARKVTRLANLRKHADVMVNVDSEENVMEIDRAARAHGVTVRVLIEVDVGMHRAGVQPGMPTLALAKKISDCTGLKLAGLETWESHALRLQDPEEKRRAITEALDLFVDTARLIRDNDIPVKILSCGGTGTYWISAFHPGVTEVVAGGGVYGDILYKKHFGVDHEYALTVRSTVTSRPVPTRIICDAGRKTMSGDIAEPEPIGVPHVESIALSAEHGIIHLSQSSDLPRVGDRISFVVGYTDTTVFLHDQLYAARNGRVEAVWPLLGRGKLQ